MCRICTAKVRTPWYALPGIRSCSGEKSKRFSGIASAAARICSSTRLISLSTAAARVVGEAGRAGPASAWATPEPEPDAELAFSRDRCASSLMSPRRGSVSDQEDAGAACESRSASALRACSAAREDRRNARAPSCRRRSGRRRCSLFSRTKYPRSRRARRDRRELRRRIRGAKNIRCARASAARDAIHGRAGSFGSQDAPKIKPGTTKIGCARQGETTS